METKTATSRKQMGTQKEKVKKVAGNLSASYNKYKKFGDKQYTGMQIGRGHHWHYDEGDWKETKITPDLWEISYAVTKRRVGHAPENSGVPVGTEYQWYIVSHQHVKKLNANDYSTEMTGLKFKVAHKRADKDKWSATAPTQRKHLVQFFKDLIAQLEKEPIPLEFDYNGTTYKGEAFPVTPVCDEDVCYEMDVMLNEEPLGIIHCTDKGWRMKNVKDQKLVDAIGEEIFLWYE